MICKQCKKEKTIGVREFCSQQCRNLWVSDFMVKKSKKDKKQYGNNYYTKDEDISVKVKK